MGLEKPKARAADYKSVPRNETLEHRAYRVALARLDGTSALYRPVAVRRAARPQWERALWLTSVMATRRLTPYDTKLRVMIRML